MRQRLVIPGMLGLMLAFMIAPDVFGQDLNGDGKVDAVFTQKQRYNQVCFGNGTGAFTSCTDVRGAGQFQLSDQINTTAAALVDWDQDGDLDITFAMEGHANVVCLNDGGGSFNTGIGCPALFSFLVFPFDSEDIAVGDLDGDQVPDFVWANGGNAGLPLNQPNLFCPGGIGNCQEFGGLEPSTGVALGDVDNDGDLDVLFSNRGTQNTVCLNNGNSLNGMEFDCRSVPQASNVAATKQSNAVAVGYLPGGFGVAPDGLLDVVFANNGKNEVCFGTGDWSGTNVGLNCLGLNTVSSFTLNDATASSTDVVIADVLPTIVGPEILFANADAPNVRCLGTFTCGFQYQPTHIVDWNGFQVSEPIPETTLGVAVRDIDVDGKPDVVVANAGVSRTYLGNFTDVVANSQVTPTSVVVSGGNVGPSADTDPPVISGASDITVEATGPAGATVTFNVTASDAGDGGGVPVTCIPSSGSTFPIDSTTVGCSAQDSSGNSDSVSFTVTVTDLTAPTIAYPNDIAIELPAGQSSTTVAFSVSASDVVDGLVPVQCTPSSGSVFPVGTTTVSCSATDTRGNAASVSFTVTITQFSVQQQITNLSQTVESLPALDQASENMLLKTLDMVSASLAKSNTMAATTSATNQLSSFQNKVRALANSGRISRSDADAIIHTVDVIKANLQ